MQSYLSKTSNVKTSYSIYYIKLLWEILHIYTNKNNNKKKVLKKLDLIFTSIAIKILATNLSLIYYILYFV